MQDQAVDPRSIVLWRWTTLVWGLVLLAGGLLPIAVAQAANSALFGLFWLVLLAGIVLLAFMLWWYPPVHYRHLAYQVDETGITIRQGIFWRRQSSLPHVRIQHTDVSQGPLQRHYGVATLKLYTAGSRFTRIELPGLSYATAVALRDDLQQRGGGDAV